MPKQISFVIDDETAKTIELLQKELRAPTNAALFRKALALTELAVEQARGSGGVVELRGRNAPDQQAVNVALKA